MVRYKLTNDCKQIYNENKEKIPVDNRQITFVDLLNPPIEEGICEIVKIRAYFPDGRVIIGEVIGSCITLHNQNELYDGRFNASNVTPQDVRIHFMPM